MNIMDPKIEWLFFPNSMFDKLQVENLQRIFLYLIKIWQENEKNEKYIDNLDCAE